jgi:uncharacterized protein HemY
MAEKTANEVLNNPACDPESGLRAVIVLAGIALINHDWEKLDICILKASKYAPASPEILLVAADSALDEKRLDLANKYLAAAERIAPKDPAVKAFRQKMEK